MLLLTAAAVDEVVAAAATAALWMTLSGLSRILSLGFRRYESDGLLKPYWLNVWK